MAKGDDIQERLIDFAVRTVRLCGSLPRTQAARHVSGQLLRSGTAPAAHYAEARGAESTRDFVHKLRICLKELNESNIWLQIIQRSDMIPAAKIDRTDSGMRRTEPHHQRKHPYCEPEA